MRQNVTLEDVSPLITYFNPPGSAILWGDSANSDPCRSSYSGSSFSGTAIDGATATFTFNGTGVWIYGAKRQNHGNYTVTLDDNVPTEYNGFGLGVIPNGCNASAFQVPLYGQGDLTMGSHTVVLTNQVTNPDLNWVDIDFITFETEFGTDQDEQTETTIDDADSAFTYNPDSQDWALTRPNATEYLDGTLHMADAQASTTIEFEGDAISLFGAVDTIYGDFVATLDSEAPLVLSAQKFNFYPRTLLYHANTLGPGTHRLTLVNGPQYFDVDYATVWSYTEAPAGSSTTASSPSTTSPSDSSTALPSASSPPSPSDPGTPSPSNSSTPSPSSSDVPSSPDQTPSNIGMIAGAAGGGAAVLIGILLGLVFYFRKRRHRHQHLAQFEAERDQEGLEPFQDITAVPFTGGRWSGGPIALPAASSKASLGHFVTPGAMFIENGSSSRAGSSADDWARVSRTGSSDTSRETPRRSGRSDGASTTASYEAKAPVSSRKRLPPAPVSESNIHTLPPSASRNSIRQISTPSTSGNSKRSQPPRAHSNRSFQSRAQDAGHIAGWREDEDDEDHVETLPPDYMQATERNARR